LAALCRVRHCDSLPGQASSSFGCLLTLAYVFMSNFAVSFWNKGAINGLLYVCS
jgi:hypothetical protein